PLRDDKLRISVPMTTTPNAFLNIGTPGRGLRFRSPASERIALGSCGRGIACPLPSRYPILAPPRPRGAADLEHSAGRIDDGTRRMTLRQRRWRAAHPRNR